MVTGTDTVERRREILVQSKEGERARKHWQVARKVTRDKRQKGHRNGVYVKSSEKKAFRQVNLFLDAGFYCGKEGWRSVYTQTHDR